MILFGSRARGDYDTNSDWDFALVYEGERPSLSGLPWRLPGRGIDCVRMKRSRAMRRRNLCGVPHAVAADGVCLLGSPLPKPEKCEASMEDAWKLLVESQKRAWLCLQAANEYWRTPPDLRNDHESMVAENSGKAAGLLRKAVLSMGWSTRKKTHSVEDEAVHKSIGRLAGVISATGEVARAACDRSDPEETGNRLDQLLWWTDRVGDEIDALEAGDCPPEIVDCLDAAFAESPPESELRCRLGGRPDHSKEAHRSR